VRRTGSRVCDVLGGCRELLVIGGASAVSRLSFYPRTAALLLYCAAAVVRAGLTAQTIAAIHGPSNVTALGPVLVKLPIGVCAWCGRQSPPWYTRRPLPVGPCFFSTMTSISSLCLCLASVVQCLCAHLLVGKAHSPMQAVPCCVTCVCDLVWTCGAQVNSPSSCSRCQLTFGHHCCLAACTCPWRLVLRRLGASSPQLVRASCVVRVCMRASCVVRVSCMRASCVCRVCTVHASWVCWAPCEPHGCLVVCSACECVCVMCESVCLPASLGAADAGPWSWFDVTPSPSPSPPVVTSLSPSPSRAVSSTPSSVAGTTTMSRSPLPTNGAGVTVSLATGLQLNYLSTVTSVTFRATYTGGTWYVWAALVVHLRVELCGPVDRG
jgi:hypothetical protein